MNLEDAREIAMMYNYIEHCDDEIRRYEFHAKNNNKLYVSDKQAVTYNNVEIFNYIIDKYREKIDKYKKRIEEYELRK